MHVAQHQKNKKVKIPKEMFFPRMHTDGQKACEKDAQYHKLLDKYKSKL